MIVKRTIFFDSNKNPVELYGYPDRPLGQGGEGAVYTVYNTDRVAKIYKATSAEKTKKLNAMLQCKPLQFDGYMAWPLDLVYAAKESQDCVGFVMPEISLGSNGEYHEVFDLYNPSSRKQLFALVNYQFIVRAATNCATAFENTHAVGHLVGDVNQKNVLVNQKALIKLIDCDSFQIKDRQTGEIFRCPVGVGEFTAPELHGIPFDQIQRIENHDNFGLAVLIFQLLLMGRHPFSGKWLGNGDSLSIADYVKNRFYAYSKTAKQLIPAPLSLPRSFLPDYILELCDRAFETSARPSAEEWRKQLEKFEKSLKKCSAAGDPHLYPPHLSSCIWCNPNYNHHFSDPQQTKPVVAQTPINQKPFTSTQPQKVSKQTPSAFYQQNQSKPPAGGNFMQSLLLISIAVGGFVFFSNPSNRNWLNSGIVSKTASPSTTSPATSELWQGATVEQVGLIQTLLQYPPDADGICPVLQGPKGSWLSIQRQLEASSKPPKGDGPEADRLNKAGLDALKSHDYSSATTSFEQACRADPSDSKSYSNLGFAEMCLDHLDSAEKHLHDSIVLAPIRPAPWRTLGKILFKKGDFNHGLASFFVGYHYTGDDPDYLQSLQNDHDLEAHHVASGVALLALNRNRASQPDSSNTVVSSNPSANADNSRYLNSGGTGLTNADPAKPNGADNKFTSQSGFAPPRSSSAGTEAVGAPRKMGNIGPYRQDLLERIAANWHPRQQHEALTVRFTVGKDGRVLDAQIVKSSGNNDVDIEAQSAIEATKFSPLPDWYKGEYLTFKIDLGKVEKYTDGVQPAQTTSAPPTLQPLRINRPLRAEENKANEADHELEELSRLAKQRHQEPQQDQP